MGSNPRSWDYISSRRTKKDQGKDFAPSLDMQKDPSVKQRLTLKEKKRKASEGLAPLEEDNDMGRMARQFGLIDRDAHGVYVPAWFIAVYNLTPGPKSVLLTASGRLKEAVAKTENSSREKVLIISEYLLHYPFCDEWTRAACMAVLDRVRR